MHKNSGGQNELNAFLKNYLITKGKLNFALQNASKNFFPLRVIDEINEKF